MNAEELLFALLRQVLDQEPDPAIRQCCTDQMLAQVCLLAGKHDVAHLAAHALEKLDLPPSEPLAKLQGAKRQAVFRYLYQDYEYGRICSVLEAGGIAYIPLKGAVLRAIYPEPWMRTSGDIDILIHEEDLDKAVDLLVSKLSYATDRKKHYHDLSLKSGSGVLLELHFSIRENMDRIDSLLSRAWDHAKPAEGCRYMFEDEFLRFHLLAHMAYHFAGGGCGIRPFMDLYLLHRQRCDETVLDEYLAQCGLRQFYEGVQALTAVWFSGQPHTQITERMERYLLDGGVYGIETQRIAVQQNQKGGKLGYLFYRVFQPYRDLKYRYRILMKYPALYPVMLIRRWIELPFSGRLKASFMEFDTNRRIDSDQVAQVNEILDQLGLQNISKRKT